MDNKPLEGFKLLKKISSYDNGEGNSETTLGWKYFTGENSPEISIDYEKSFLWNTLGAKKGHAIAHSNLALLYFAGYGLERDLTRRFSFNRKC